MQASAASFDVPPSAPNSKRQRTDLDVDASVRVKMMDTLQHTVRAEHAARVRIVRVHDAAVFLGEILRSVLGIDHQSILKDTIGDEQLPPRPERAG